MSKMNSDSEYTLVVILGDQLTLNMSSLQAANCKQSIVLMAEVRAETEYVKHHKKKIAFIFSAMRHFASLLQTKGWKVEYRAFDDAANQHSLCSEINSTIEKYGIKRVIISKPGEWRLLDAFSSLTTTLAAQAVELQLLEDTRFIASTEEFNQWSTNKKQLTMEFFYREMRRKTGLLMSGDNPIGKKWNYDSENRLPAKDGMPIPAHARIEADNTTKTVLELVELHFHDHFGSLDNFYFGVTAEDAELAFEHFIATALPNFGDYQDAILLNEHSLFHSLLALYINTGLLDPLLVCQRVESEYHAGNIPLNSAEGFIRQIIGWREYVRGIYWLKMPNYLNNNYFGNTRKLPAFYWDAETPMLCVKQCVEQTREHAYAHHIQRLMVTGNFAMLAGIDPIEIHEWYLAVYADAYEWVELPNTLGMSQFADGGLLGSKPYAAGGNYINKMSNYCKSCSFNVKAREGETACPFNYLYWDFLQRNRAKLQGNHRLAMAYRNLDKMTDERRAAIEQDSERFLNSI